MRLSTFIQRTRALGDAKVPGHIVDQLAERIDGGADLGAILKKRSATLTARLLLGIWRANRRYTAHMAFLDEVGRRRREAGERVIPPTLLKHTLAAHEVAALERAETMAPPGRGPEHRRRDAIKEAVTLWKHCLAATRREGKLTIAAVGDPEGLDPSVSALLGVTTLVSISADTWRAVRRAEAAGLIQISLEAPVERMTAQVSARGAELKALTSGRTLEEFLGALILVDVHLWALRLKDEEALILTTRDACNAWFELLTAARPAEALYAAVWIPEPGEPMGVAVVGRDGRPLHTDVVAGDDALAAVEGVLGGHPVEAVVLPESAADPARLEALLAGFTTLPVYRADVRAVDAGLATVDHEAEPAALRALIMARRRLRPLKYWGQIDPLDIGLVDHQDELDADTLQLALQDMRTLALAGVRPEDLQKSAPARSARSPRVQQPLNPMIKSVDDLRPGLTVNGLVTNITQFGAFVNIGLSHEGLVHVSELADHFVNDPKEVVTVGQQVEARVLSVDRGRRRISLSLRPDQGASPPQRDGSPAEPGSKLRLDDIPGTRGERRRGVASERGRGGGGPGGPSRAQALRELEALFKKK